MNFNDVGNDETDLGFQIVDWNQRSGKIINPRFELRNRNVVVSVSARAKVHVIDGFDAAIDINAVFRADVDYGIAQSNCSNAISLRIGLQENVGKGLSLELHFPA